MIKLRSPARHLVVVNPAPPSSQQPGAAQEPLPSRPPQIPEGLPETEYFAAVQLTAAWIGMQLSSDALGQAGLAAGDRSPEARHQKLRLLGRTIAGHTALEHADDWDAIHGTPTLGAWAAFARAVGLIDGYDFAHEEALTLIAAYREELASRYARTAGASFRARLDADDLEACKR
jgi:hypothetical protein